MSIITKEYCEKVFVPLRSWWDWHPDRSPSDFDQVRPAFRGEPMTPEEEAAFYEEQEKLPNPIY